MALKIHCSRQTTVTKSQIINHVIVNCSRCWAGDMKGEEKPSGGLGLLPEESVEEGLSEMLRCKPPSEGHEGTRSRTLLDIH